MNDKLQELIDKRNAIDKQQRDLNDKVLKEQRDFTPEEQESWDKMNEDFNAITDEIKRLKEAEQRKVDRLKALEGREEIKYQKTDPIKPDPKGKDRKAPVEREKGLVTFDPRLYRHVDPRVMLLRGDFLPDTNEKRWIEAAKLKCADGALADSGMALWRDYLAYGARHLSYEQVRALQADLDKTGGYMVGPEQFVADLIKDKDRMVFIRRLAKVIPVTKAESLGVPVLEDDPADPVWTGEVLTGNEDSTMDFAKRPLHPHPLAKRIKVSEKLLRVSAIPVDALVRERLAYKFGVTEESHFLTGSGVNQPLGVMTDSAHGITGARDYSTGNTTTSLKADGLIGAKYELESQYRTNCIWMFHRDKVEMIRKLKDGNGQYLWKAGISRDDDDTILNFPVYESEYMSNGTSSKSRVGILGDFTQYWIADSLSYRVKVLTELYAETGQIGYIGRQEVDGAPVHEKAFIRVQLA